VGPPGFFTLGGRGVGGLLDQGHLDHLVAHHDLVHHVHARQDLAEHGVLHIQEGRRALDDEELATAGVGRRGLGHGQAPELVLEAGLQLIGNGEAGTAPAGAGGVPALDDEVGHHPVEGDPVVEALLHQQQEAAGRNGGVLVKQLHQNIALVGADLHYRTFGFVH
jgi:hypothetical protein